MNTLPILATKCTKCSTWAPYSTSRIMVDMKIVCAGCAELTAAEMASTNAPLMSAILRNWSQDPAAQSFVTDSRHSVEMLTWLGELSKRYAFQDTVDMVNSVVLERLRHGSANPRQPTAGDVRVAYLLCKARGFPPVQPDAVVPAELAAFHLAPDAFGFVAPSPLAPPGGAAARHGACVNGPRCRYAASPRDAPAFFTLAFRARGGCVVWQ